MSIDNVRCGETKKVFEMRIIDFLGVILTTFLICVVINATGVYEVSTDFEIVSTQFLEQAICVLLKKLSESFHLKISIM